MKFLRKIGPQQAESIKVTALGAMFWAAFAFSPYQSVYLKRIGFSASSTGLLNAIAFVVAIVSVAFWGMVSDKIGSLKKILFIVILGGSALHALIPLVPTVFPAHSTMAFFLFIPFLSFFRASMAPMAENIQVRNCNELRLNYGVSRAIGSLVFTASSWMASFLLADFMDVSGTFLFTFLLFIPTLVLVLLVRNPEGRKNSSDDKEKKEKVDIKDLFKNKQYMIFLLFSFLFYTACNCGNAFIPFFMEEINISGDKFGFFLAYRAFLEAPLLILMNRLRLKFDIQKLLMAGVIMMAVEGLLLCFFASSMSTLLLATTFYGLGNGLFIGTSMNYLYQLAPADLRASAQAFFASVASVAGIVGNLFGGMLFDGIGAQYFYLFVCGAYIFSVVIFALSAALAKKGKKPKTAAA
jgi:Arabinose efflux permease